MIVVTNSSPLIALSIASSMDLLHSLYDTIHIPEAVFNEVVMRGSGRLGATAVANTPWIVQQAAANQHTVTSLRNAGLDLGESEAIVLASELSAGLLSWTRAVPEGSLVSKDFRLLGRSVCSSPQRECWNDCSDQTAARSVECCRVLH